jgi:hypothetical protein
MGRSSQIAYIVRKLSAPTPGHIGVNLFVVSTSLANLAALLFARPAYRRHRVAAHFAMRLMRLGVHVWSSLVVPERGARWWTQHTLSQRSVRPRQVLARLLVRLGPARWRGRLLSVCALRRSCVKGMLFSKDNLSETRPSIHCDVAGQNARPA